MDIIWHGLLLCFTVISANSYFACADDPHFIWFTVIAVLAVNLLAGSGDGSLYGRRMKICRHGAVSLVLFLIGATVSVVIQSVIGVKLVLAGRGWDAVSSVLMCVGILAVLFWNGIISVYTTSYQLGIKLRVIGIICGPIPVANLVALGLILKTVFREIGTERMREARNRARDAEKVCETRYPLLLVHGVFFRDSRYIDYWGRIPEELKRNGATVYYGEHGSAAAVADSAAELTERIRQIVSETGCGKVNIIAHSKGGLDCRYAIAETGAADMIASLTTVNTPHRGCIFADRLLEKIPKPVQDKVASTYNKALRRFGDKDPDFMAAVRDLTASGCRRFEALPAPSGEIFTRSVGSVMPKASGGKFPLNLSYHLVKYYDGVNDGLVSEDSFEWGGSYTLLKPKGDRGISHGDMVDLNREDIPGFDVREFYVELVKELKDRGL